MKPRGPRALLRNKENPELERIPRAPAAPAPLARACRPPSCAPPALPPIGRRGPAPLPPRAGLAALSLRISGTPAPQSPLSLLLSASILPPDPARPSLPVPNGTPQPYPAPRARPSYRPGAGRPNGLLWVGVGPVPLDWSSPLPASGAARGRGGGDGRREAEKEAGPREVTPAVPKLGVGVRGPQGCPRALGQTARPTDRREPLPDQSPPAGGPPSRGPPTQPSSGPGGGAHPAFGRPGLLLAAPASG